jgi:hypothetical protein
VGREAASVRSGLVGWTTGGTFDVICMTAPDVGTIRAHVLILSLYRMCRMRNGGRFDRRCR